MRCCRQLKNVTSNSTLVKARSLGTITGMEATGIIEYQIVASQDEKTCPICKEMDGKIFSVEKTISFIEKVLQITDHEKFKKQYHGRLNQQNGRQRIRLYQMV